MKVLVAETHSHLKVLENVYHLLKGRCELSFYVNKISFRKFGSLFPSSKDTTLIINEFHSSLFFVWLLFHARKFDYINVSTGPEGGHFSDIINIICFYLCCIFYGKKIILTVKRVQPYLKSTGGLFANLRSRSIKKLKRFTFETKTVRDVFRERAGIKDCLLGVSYDRYTDLFDPVSRIEKKERDDEVIRIGLLGTIAPNRRDYGVIVDALEKLLPEELSGMCFVTLGGCSAGRNNKIIQSLEKYVEVDCCEGILSAEEFDSRGISCDILISPLNNTYGTFNGSGSFGDMLYLRKRIIIPSYVDKEREFKEAAVYYQDTQELLEIFRNIQQLSKVKVDPAYYEQFSTKSVFEGLVKDLKLA